MVHGIILLSEEGELIFNYKPGKIPIPTIPGREKVITLPESKARKLLKIQDQYLEAQEELYEAFYAADE
jgi:hypothetical protein